MAELRLELRSPSGETVTVEWDEDALTSLDPGGDAAPMWRLSGELDWNDVEALRVLSGRLGDSRVLAIAAIRPRGAAGHGEDAIAGALAGPDGVESLAEVLFSTEYDEAGMPRRVGLELYREGADLPLRLAGDLGGGETLAEGAVNRRRATGDLRGGEAGPGAAVLELLTAS